MEKKARHTPDRDEQASRPREFLGLEQRLDMVHSVVRGSAENLKLVFVGEFCALWHSGFTRSLKLLHGQTAGSTVVCREALHDSDRLRVPTAADEEPRRLLEGEDEEAQGPEYKRESAEGEE